MTRLGDGLAARLDLHQRLRSYAPAGTSARTANLVDED